MSDENIFPVALYVATSFKSHGRVSMHTGQKVWKMSNGKVYIAEDKMDASTGTYYIKLGQEIDHVDFYDVLSRIWEIEFDNDEVKHGP